LGRFLAHFQKAVLSALAPIFDEKPGAYGCTDGAATVAMRAYFTD
jgi:hypothetical protein